MTKSNRSARVLWGVLLGLGTSAGAAPLTVEWSVVTTNQDGSAISDLAGYRVYYSSQSFNRGGWLTPAQARSAADVMWSAGAAGTVSRTLDLTEGATYYVRLTAFDTAGNESVFNLSTGGLEEEVSAYLAGPSVVSIGGTPKGLKEAYAYPNPAAGADPVIRAMMGGVEWVEVTIFDQAGKPVHAARTTNAVSVNGEAAFEYIWTGDKAPGVYYAVIHGKSGNETVRARTSFAVVK